jgi:hypothetical protein
MGQLTSITLIKADTMQIDLILEEIKEIFAVGTNCSNGNGTKHVLIDQISKRIKKMLMSLGKWIQRPGALFTKLTRVSDVSFGNFLL